MLLAPWVPAVDPGAAVASGACTSGGGRTVCMERMPRVSAACSRRAARAAFCANMHALVRPVSRVELQQLDRVLALLRLLASAASTPRAVYQLRCSGVCPSRPALRRLRHDTASSAAAMRRRGRRAGRHPTNFLDEREPARRQTSRPLTVEYRRARARELARVGGRPTRVRRSRTLESYARAAAGGHAIGRRHQQTRDPI